MSEIEVRIVKVDPMRVASVWGFGESPELIAYGKLLAWAKPKGLLDDCEKHRVFGFNNPNPSPGSPNYGYEYWITVGPDMEPEGDVRILDFRGGLYAVARCEIQGDPAIIGETWKLLDAWVAESAYRMSNHQWLEEHLNTENILEGTWTMDLYYPITQ
ncbi:MAG: hypothetical protein A2Y73_02815 [Chloroflexi bacterium RBG_13_56_8]|nr:MAG: hypothetical protein A2Y73_02815 [Chloroflexi bacterium RBG_13_56_8]